MHIRRYTLSDAEALAALYRDAARTLGRQAYSEAQTRVWARYPEDIEAFRATLAAGVTLCAVDGDVIAAFGQLNPMDHVAFLYCAPAHARKGYASALLERLESHARQSGAGVLQVEASRVARPLFERQGFVVVEEERPVRYGIEFVRFKMEKRLSAR